MNGRYALVIKQKPCCITVAAEKLLIASMKETGVCENSYIVKIANQVTVVFA